MTEKVWNCFFPLYTCFYFRIRGVVLLVGRTGFSYYFFFLDFLIKSGTSFTPQPVWNDMRGVVGNLKSVLTGRNYNFISNILTV